MLPPSSRANPNRTGVSIVAVLSLLTAIGSAALDPSRSILQYNIQKWDATQGLPQNSIQALLQSRDGYLWIGTQEGLVRFDGAHFTVFDKTNTAAMARSDVRSLLEARDGSLWAGIYGGGVLYLKGDEKRAYAVKDNLAGDSVLSLAQDGSGAVWVGTETGLSRIVGHEIATFRLSAQGLPSDFVTALCPDGESALWVGTEGGLCRYSSGRFTRVELPQAVESPILSLSQDRGGELWVGTRKGLARGRPGSFLAVTPKEGLPDREVWSILMDREGNRWLGTGAGLCRCRDGRFECLGVEQGLSYPVVRSLCEDAEGSLWVGTNSGGLNRLKDGSFATYGVREGLSADFVWTVCEAKAGGLWLGTDIGGLNYFKDGEFKAFGAKEGLEAFEITGLCEDRDGTLWVGGREGLFHGVGSHFARVPPSAGVPSGRVRAIYQTRNGDLWIGTHGGGLGLLRNGRFRTFTTADGLPSNFIRGIIEDHKGVLWVGTSGAGIAIFDGRRFVRPQGSQGVENAYIMCIHEDPDGGLWFGTSDAGLIMYKGGRFVRFVQREGLPDDSVFQILEDDQSYLWMTSNRGIARVPRKSLEAHAADKSVPIEMTTYSSGDGLASSECNGGSQPAGCRTRDGRLWFPTIKGVVVVDPKRLRRNTVPPPVKIEEFLADGEMVPPTAEAAIPPGKRSLEVRYTALSFLAPERVLFRYKLEGYDDRWVDAGTRRTAYYTALPPARYRFRVVACNNDGIWNNTGATLEFKILPRFYQTWPFRVAVLLALAMAGYALFRVRVMVRVRALRARQADLEKVVELRTAELKSANLALERLAAMDSLTGLANHRTFHEDLDKEWRRCLRLKSPLSLIFIDIDHFKPYNDAYGHQEGDECLRRVAGAIASQVRRPTDITARYGGEEFAVILADTSKEGARHVAEAQRLAVENLAIPHGSSPVSPFVTVSLGVATALPCNGGTAEALLGRADAALYRAKAAGRNQVVVAQEPDTVPSENK